MSHSEASSKALAVTLLAVLALAGTGGASASRFLQVGVFDDAQTLYGNPDRSFPMLKTLRAQVLRVNLYWGGRFGVAQERPDTATDPADPAYDWSSYDRTVLYGQRYGVKILFSIIGTPGWANRGAGINHVPMNPTDLRNFALAAATRYSGTFERDDGVILPAVRNWLAWNEPNNPKDLQPQYKRVRGRWIIQSAIDYTKICNAIYTGVHLTLFAGQRVACGATAPRGGNRPTGIRPSVSPIVFLRALRKAGLRRFDAYAHHPYYGKPTETPTTKPRRTAVTLANINELIRELTRLYGPKRVWITEYGYQTRPPDRAFGISWALQARYLTQAFTIARKNPRIDMMIWFLLRDDSQLGGWQSGFLTASGQRKPAFTAFQRLKH